MPYTIPEGLATLPEVIAFFEKLRAGALALPTPLTGKALGDLIASVSSELGSIVDRIRADAVD